MEVTYRSVTEDALDQYEALASYCFHMEQDDAAHYARRFFHPDYAIGAFAKDRLLSLAWYVPYEMHLSGRFHEMAGVSGVATASQWRRAGLVKEIMTRLQRHMREHGFFISYLYPFNWEFYRKMGWEYAVERKSLCFEPRDLRDFSKEVSGMTMSGDWDTESMRLVRERQAVLWNGNLRINDRLWASDKARHERKKQHCCLFREGPEPCAYLTFRFDKGEKGGYELVVLSWAVRAVNDFKKVCCFLANHQGQNRFIRISGPVFFPFERFLANHWIETKVSRVAMVKVIDVKRAVEQRAFPAATDGAVVLRVEGDPACPWNNDVFSFAVDSGRCTVEPGRAPQATLSIQAFSQLFGGHTSVEELGEVGRIEGTEEAIETLGRMFPQRPFHFSDPF